MATQRKLQNKLKWNKRRRSQPSGGNRRNQWRYNHRRNTNTVDSHDDDYRYADCGNPKIPTSHRKNRCNLSMCCERATNESR
ncbi:hypothetical protein RP20_CCG006977 [Aedes albopictus]|nr:hypothetical protein RP20_CCG006977 [Aedes albopictus]